MKLTMFEVKTAEDFEAMRVVRNSCATFLTGNPQQITPEEQVLWSQTLDRTLVQPFVFEWVIPAGGVAYHHVIGYGLVRLLPRYDGTRWISGGLLPKWRGQGLGKELFRQLADFVTGTNQICWLDVRPDNVPALRTYRSLGFMQLDGTIEKGGIDVIEMFRDPLYGRRREVM